MNRTLRGFLIWALGILLLVYVAGTVRLAWPLLTGYGTQGVPTSSIIGGFYFRLVIMGIFFYVFLRLRRNRPPDK